MSHIVGWFVKENRYLEDHYCFHILKNQLNVIKNTENILYIKNLIVKSNFCVSVEGVGGSVKCKKDQKGHYG